MYRPILIPVIFHCCIRNWHRESMSSMLREISASSLTASCRCQHRFLQPFVVLAITSFGSCVRLFDVPVWGRRQNPDPGFHQYSAGFLQLVVLRHDSRWFDEPSAVSSERRHASHYRSQAVRAHHASSRSSASLALAASPQTSGFQDIHPRVSFIGWQRHRSCVPSHGALIALDSMT